MGNYTHNPFMTQPAHLPPLKEGKMSKVELAKSQATREIPLIT